MVILKFVVLAYNGISEFFQNSLNSFAPESRKRFFLELSESDYKHSQILCISSLFVHIFILYIDYEKYLHGYWKENTTHYSLFLMHLALFSVFTFTLILIRLLKKIEVNSFNSYISLFLNFYTQIWSAVFSAFDQKLFGDVSIYLLAMFGLPAIFHITLKTEMIKLILAQSIFVYLLFYFNIDRGRIEGLIINTFTAMFFGLIISRIIFNFKLNQFISYMKIHDQAVELEKKNASQDLILKIVAHDLPSPLAKWNYFLY